MSHPTSARTGCLGWLAGLFQPSAEAVRRPDVVTIEELRAPVPVDDPQPTDTPLPYRLRDDFLSPAERSFYGVLRLAVSEAAVVCPKVGLRDVLFVSGPDDRQAHINRIDRKHVDFLLCDTRTLRPLAAIELDDASHQAPARQERDRLVEAALEAARLPLVRFAARRAYRAVELTQALAPHVPGLDTELSAEVATEVSPQPPLCPTCGVPMVLRTARSGRNAGGQFYGCPNYPQCRQIMSLGGEG